MQLHTVAAGCHIHWMWDTDCTVGLNTIINVPIVRWINMYFVDQHIRTNSWPFPFASLLLYHRILLLTGSYQLKSLFSRQRMVCSIWIDENCFHTFPRRSICICIISGWGTGKVFFFFFSLLFSWLCMQRHEELTEYDAQDIPNICTSIWEQFS